MHEINEQELRLGNYLLDGEGRMCKVKSLPLETFGVAAVNGPVTTMPIRPIPLTEFWLEKFEYRPISEESPAYLGKCEIHLNKAGWWFGINGGEYLYGKPMKYVHQLQNFYFCLSGEELTIKK